MIKFFICLCLMLFCRHQLLAQDNLSWRETDPYAVAYMDSVSKYAALFSGNRQAPFLISTTNHRYFIEEEYTKGRLSFCGIVYPDISLRWDLYQDEMMIYSPNNFNVVLKSEYIDFVEIYGYHIIHLHPDGLSGCPPAGLYIRLYSGEYLLLEKLNAVLFDKQEYNTISHYFALTKFFYLQKDGIYFKIKNRRTLLKTLDTHRKEMKRFIEANKFKYRHHAEKMVLEVVKEHEKLNRL